MGGCCTCFKTEPRQQYDVPEMKELPTDITKLQTDIEQLKTDIKKAGPRQQSDVPEIKELSTNIKRLQTESEQMKTEIRTMEGKHAESNLVIKELQTYITKLQTDMEQLKTEIEKMEKEKDSMIQQLSETKRILEVQLNANISLKKGTSETHDNEGETNQAFEPDQPTQQEVVLIVCKEKEYLMAVEEQVNKIKHRVPKLVYPKSHHLKPLDFKKEYLLGATKVILVAVPGGDAILDEEGPSQLGTCYDVAKAAKISIFVINLEQTDSTQKRTDFEKEPTLKELKSRNRLINVHSPDGKTLRLKPENSDDDTIDNKVVEWMMMT